MQIIIGLILGFILGLVIADPQRPDQAHPSPDGVMVARLTSVSQQCLESRIEIRRRGSPSLFRKSYGSADCEHGMNIIRGAWTPDSMFFVFNAQMSGGHQPWHWPVYCYCRRDNKIYTLDEAVGPIVAPEFGLKTPHFVETRVLEQGNNAGRGITIDLNQHCKRHRRQPKAY